MDDARSDLLLVISFGVVSSILIIAGLIFYLEGYDIGLIVSIIVCGIGFMIATIGIAHDFGFIDWEWSPL